LRCFFCAAIFLRDSSLNLEFQLRQFRSAKPLNLCRSDGGDVVDGRVVRKVAGADVSTLPGIVQEIVGACAPLILKNEIITRVAGHITVAVDIERIAEMGVSKKSRGKPGAFLYVLGE
jgi:hypothetical protein